MKALTDFPHDNRLGMSYAQLSMRATMRLNPDCMWLDGHCYPAKITRVHVKSVRVHAGSRVQAGSWVVFVRGPASNRKVPKVFCIFEGRVPVQTTHWGNALAMFQNGKSEGFVEEAS